MDLLYEQRDRSGRSDRIAASRLESGENLVEDELVSIDWDDYEVYNPGTPGALDTMPRADARKAFQHLMQARLARVQMLRQLLRANGVELDDTDEAVQLLNDWFGANVQPDPGRPGWMLLVWYSVCNDIALFLGDLAIKRHPNLRWEFFIWGKNNLSYHHAVIMGFDREGVYPKYDLDLIDIIMRYGQSVIAAQGSVASHGVVTVRGVDVDIDAVIAKHPTEVDRDRFLRIMNGIDEWA